MFIIIASTTCISIANTSFLMRSLHPFWSSIRLPTSSNSSIASFLRPLKPIPSKSISFFCLVVKVRFLNSLLYQCYFLSFVFVRAIVSYHKPLLALGRTFAVFLLYFSALSFTNNATYHFTLSFYSSLSFLTSFHFHFSFHFTFIFTLRFSFNSFSTLSVLFRNHFL